MVAKSAHTLVMDPYQNGPFLKICKQNRDAFNASSGYWCSCHLAVIVLDPRMHSLVGPKHNPAIRVTLDEDERGHLLGAQYMNHGWTRFVRLLAMLSCSLSWGPCTS